MKGWKENWVGGGAFLKLFNNCYTCWCSLKKVYVTCCGYLTIWNPYVNIELKIAFPDISSQLYFCSMTQHTISCSLFPFYIFWLSLSTLNSRGGITVLFHFHTNNLIPVINCLTSLTLWSLFQVISITCCSKASLGPTYLKR